MFLISFSIFILTEGHAFSFKVIIIKNPANSIEYSEGLAGILVPNAVKLEFPTWDVVRNIPIIVPCIYCDAIHKIANLMQIIPSANV